MSDTRKERKSQQGASLIGMLISILILLIMLSVTFRGITAMIKNNRATRQRTLAVLVAQDKLEELKMAEKMPRDGRHIFAPAPAYKGTLAAAKPYYEIERDAGLAKVKVVVRWGRAAGQKVVLSTLVNR